MTKRTQRSTGEMISTLVFAAGGLVLLGGAMDPQTAPGTRALLALGAVGGFAAAGRFVIAAMWERRR